MKVRLTDFNAIGRDLELIDLVEAIGSKQAKRKAAKHKQAIYAAIKSQNHADGLDTLSDDDLLKELT